MLTLFVRDFEIVDGIRTLTNEEDEQIPAILKFVLGVRRCRVVAGCHHQRWPRGAGASMSPPASMLSVGHRGWDCCQ